MITATRFTRCDASAPAILFGTYPSARAASSTRDRVFSDTSPRFLSTRLTVISLTPDASETSLRVRGRLLSAVILRVLPRYRFVNFSDKLRRAAIGLARVPLRPSDGTLQSLAPGAGSGDKAAGSRGSTG